MNSLALLILECKFQDCTPEEKLFFIMCGEKFGLIPWPSRSGRALAKRIGVTPRTAVTGLAFLRKEKLIEDLDVGTPPIKSCKFVWDLTERLGEFRHIAIAHNQHLAAARNNSIDLITYKDRDILDPRWSAKLNNSNRLLLMVLLFYADDAGVVSTLGTADLSQLTGMREDRLDSQFEKLILLKYMLFKVSGTNAPKIFGVVKNKYYLNLKEMFNERASLDFKLNTFWRRYRGEPLARLIVLDANDAFIAIVKTQINMPFKRSDEEESNEGEESSDKEESNDEESNEVAPCLTLGRPITKGRSHFNLSEDMFSFRGGEFISLDSAKEIFSLLSSLKSDDKLIKIFQSKFDEIVGFLLNEFWVDLDDSEVGLGDVKQSSTSLKDHARVREVTKAKFATNIFHKSKLQDSEIEVLRESFFNLVICESIRVATLINFEISKVLAASNCLENVNGKYFLFSESNVDSRNTALSVKAFVRCSDVNRLKFQESVDDASIFDVVCATW